MNENEYELAKTESNTSAGSKQWGLQCRLRIMAPTAATDAEHQNRIILHDNALNLPVVARQPHPDPNYASFTAARRVGCA